VKIKNKERERERKVFLFTIKEFAKNCVRDFGSVFTSSSGWIRGIVVS
jgi:hypothetical protein